MIILWNLSIRHKQKQNKKQLLLMRKIGKRNTEPILEVKLKLLFRNRIRSKISVTKLISC